MHLHGVVLAVTPNDGQAIVRHDAFGGMPAMTMAFRITPRSVLGKLHPGDILDATVDTTTDPWTLDEINAKPARRAAPEPEVLQHVVPLRAGDVVPDQPFVDQRGRPFRFSQLRGQDVVLAFVYTRCRDARMCPLISSKFATLQRRIGSRSIHLVEVSLDPAYDRPPVLARYGTEFGADPRVWTLAVGEPQATLAFAARFGITAFPDPKIGIIHDENTVVIGPGGAIRTMIAETAWQPDEILADIDSSHGQAANPLARLNLWLSRAAVAICGDGPLAFSGLLDLVVVLAILAVASFALFRLARVIFVKSARP